MDAVSDPAFDVVVEFIVHGEAEPLCQATAAITLQTLDAASQAQCTNDIRDALRQLWQSQYGTGEPDVPGWELTLTVKVLADGRSVSRSRSHEGMLDFQTVVFATIHSLLQEVALAL